MKKQNKPIPYGSSKPDRTKPNKALTVREINQRFVEGKPVPPAKQPIHEPKLESGINPMRIPYCDYTDVQEYNNFLEAQLNKSTELYDEKRKAFDKEVAKASNNKREALIHEAKKQLHNQ